MQSWRNDKFWQSGAMRRTTAPRAVAAALSISVVLAVLQGCSSASDTPIAAPSASQPQQKSSGFDADGPPSGTYRGGRDPVTGKAAEWSPNGPVETSAIAPLPSTGRPAPVARSAPPSQAQPPAASAGIGLQGKIKVRQGDTLDSIAQAHGITVTALMQANRLTGRSIKVGQQLVIPQ